MDYWVIYPFIWVLNTSANFVLRLFGMSGKHGHETHYCTDELKLILRGPHTGGMGSATAYNEDWWNTIAYSLDFSRMTVSDLMRLAHEMIGLRNDLPMRDNLAIITRNRFSRYSLYANASGERCSA